MDPSRRTFFKLTAGAAGALAMSAPLAALQGQQAGHAAAGHGPATHKTGLGKPFDPSQEPKRVRKSFYDLSDDELQTFCRAIGYMRNDLLLEDPLQWDNYARIHAFHCTEASAAHPPVHWSWHFLPWHRGYLYFLERILANILTTQLKLDGSTFALPYWDWSVHKEMPNTRLRKEAGLASPFFGYDLTQENMVNPDNLGFDNTALYDGNRGPSLHKPQMDPKHELTEDSRSHVAETLHFMSPQYVSFMLAAPFDQFGGKPVTDRTTGQGLLEQGPHNDGHDWIGTRIGKNRTMGTLRTAAGDPMFYMHHGNIDRLWSLYTQPQPDPAGEWGLQKYDFMDLDGSTLTLSVQELIEKTANVSYAASSLPLKAAVRPKRALAFQTVPIDQELDDQPVTVALPKDFFNHDAVLCDVQTGPIRYPGKYTIRVLCNGQFVGKIRMMDGAHRPHHTKDTMVHTFSLLLTQLPKEGDSLTFVPPKRGTIKIQLKSLAYRVL